MDDYRQYRRKQIAELADWVPGFDMDGVSVSDADKAAGSPKTGDKIARNPANHADRWLVAAAYFAANFEPILAAPQRSDDQPRYNYEDAMKYAKSMGLPTEFPEPKAAPPMTGTLNIKMRNITIHDVDAITVEMAKLSEPKAAPQVSTPPASASRRGKVK